MFRSIYIDKKSNNPPITRRQVIHLQSKTKYKDNMQNKQCNKKNRTKYGGRSWDDNSSPKSEE